jgi:PAS domain S-box-containing protein
VYEWDPRADRITHATGLESVLGWSTSRETTDRAWWASLLHPDDRAALQAHQERVLASADPVQQVTYRIHHRDGSWRWVTDFQRVLRDDAGQVARVIGCLLDVTERVAARAELEEVDRRKDAFLALLGHELRNPLSAIRSAVDILHAPSAPPGAVEHARAVVVRQTHHMGRLLDDLLDLSRIAAGKLEVREEPSICAGWCRRRSPTTSPR